MKRALLLLAIFLGLSPLRSQQIVQTTPTFIDPQDSLVIVVDLDQMPLATIPGVQVFQNVK